MKDLELKRAMRAIIDGASFIVDNSISFFFGGNRWKNAIDSVNIIPYDGRNLNYGLEIRFKQSLEDLSLRIPFDCNKISESPVSGSVINGFELTINSMAYNRLLGVNKITGFGIDIFDENDSAFSIVQTDGASLGSLQSNNAFFKAAQIIQVPANFRARGVRIYFFEKQDVNFVYQKPEFIIRLLGSVVPQYLDLLKLVYQIDLLQFQRDESVRTSEYVLPKMFNLFDFIFYYDNLLTIEQGGADGLLERKLFVQQVLKAEYEVISGLSGYVDLGTKFELLKRIDSIFYPERRLAYNHTKINKGYLADTYHLLVENSPEKCFIAEISDILDAYLVVFDSEYYQFDQIDLVTSDKYFTELTDTVLNKGCKALINGSFWGLEGVGGVGSAMKEWIAGIDDQKSNPQGHYVFRERVNGKQKIWIPGDVVESTDEFGPKIAESQRGVNKCFFYQTDGGDVVFSRGKLDAVLDEVKRGVVSFNIEVGVDNLVGYVVDDGFDVTNDSIYGSATNKYLKKNRPDYPEDANKGISLFGNVSRNGKNYFFFLVAEDAGYSVYLKSKYLGRYELCFDFLKGINARNIVFTDGGSSAGLIYQNTVVVKPSYHNIKNSLIATAIGVHAKSSFSAKIVLESRLNLGGSKEELLQMLLLSGLSQNERTELEQEIMGRLSMPFIDHPTFPRSIATAKGHFGPRVIGGVQGFHEGIDMRAQSPLNVKVNVRGKVFRQAFGGGFGNYVVLCHGRDIFRNYYFTLYAHLSSTSVSVNDVVEKDAVVGVTGETQAPGQPHLHLELIVSNKNYSDIDFDDLLSRDVHLDPEDFILPNNLLID
jgi:murein DD-endopeptidase MepM/ murein hydrolase activator NlpD